MVRGRDAGKKISVDEPSKRQERAERILDAAAELMLRWGYRKTTVDDVAKQAGVAKGTIYLHWKTRESLFEAVVIREWLRVAREYLQLIESDPEGAKLTAILRHGLGAMMNSPLLRATLLQDVEILGEMAHSTTGHDITQTRMVAAKAYFELLRAHDMVRIDTPIDMQIKVLSAITVGFLTYNNVVPENFQLAPNEMLDALIETVHRTFDPPTPADPSAVQEVTRIFKQMSMPLIDTIEKRYQEAQL